MSKNKITNDDLNELLNDQLSDSKKIKLFDNWVGEDSNHESFLHAIYSLYRTLDHDNLSISDLRLLKRATYRIKSVFSYTYYCHSQGEGREDARKKLEDYNTYLSERIEEVSNLILVKESLKNQKEMESLNRVFQFFYGACIAVLAALATNYFSKK